LAGMLASLPATSGLTLFGALTGRSEDRFRSFTRMLLNAEHHEVLKDAPKRRNRISASLMSGSFA